MEEPKPMHELGLALSKITKPKCNQYSSKLDSLLKTQAPLQGRGRGKEVAQTSWKPRCALRQRVWEGLPGEKLEQISLLKLRVDKQIQLNLK